MSDVSIRMSRLFDHRSGRCLDVAVDHGFFGEASFLTGIEDLGAAVRTLAAAGPDAIQLSPGQARLLQQLPDRNRPGLVLRSDIANVYGAPLPERLFSRLIPEPGLAAVRLDAVCVVVNLFDLPGRPEVHESCIRNVLTAKADCERYGIPLMVEPLVMKGAGDTEGARGATNAAADGYTSDGTTSSVVPLVRQAVELGADIIKADPTDDVGDYHLVVQAAGTIPVLVRGGGRVTDEELFERTAAVLEQGAAGIVYGRNVIQHRDPAGLTRALMAMLHESATAGDALAMVRE